MPATNDLPAAPRVSLLRRLLRYTGAALIAGLALFCVLLLVVRFVALPRLEAERTRIAELVSRQLGQPVEIEAIETGWDGWNPQITVRGLSVRDRTGTIMRPLLELPVVSGVVAWTSIPLFQLRLKELSIERPQLSIRRDREGRVHVAGIEIDPDAQTDDRPLVDWLLRQRLIEVRDALITWSDDRRGAPQLVLDRVQFRIESRFGHHRFGLTGDPPAEIASPIDVRGDLSGKALANWEDAKGELYVRLDYADVAAWKEWLPLPIEMGSGKGALRIWFQFAGGVANRIVADVELADVRTVLATDLPPLDLEHVSGRLNWRHERTLRELTATGLSFKPRGQPSVKPTDFEIRYQMGDGGATIEGEANIQRIELEPIARIAAALPLPPSWRRDLERFAPRGVATAARYAWKGPVDTPTSFRVRGDLIDVGSNPQDRYPGIERLSGVLDATQAGGSLRLGSHELALTLPAILPAPLRLNSASGVVSWETARDALAVRVADLEFTNADVAGSANVRWRSLASGPGEIDLRAKLSKADATRLGNYLPLTLGSDLRGWLKSAITRGTATDVDLALKGNLSEFPFADGKRGQFLLSMKAQGATLDYAPGWPPLTEIDATLRFDGPKLSVAATRGHVFGVALGRTTAEIPDLGAAHPQLTVVGEASGPATEFLAYIEHSPVGGRIDGAARGVEATGNAHLALRLDLGLGTVPPTTRVSGDFQLAGNQLRVPGLPLMSELHGTVSFTEHDVSARELALETFGGPALLTVASAEGRMTIAASGTARVAALKNEFDYPLLGYASGSTDWQLNASVGPSSASWILNSTLRGVALDLPAPLGKPADASVPLRVERHETAGSPKRDQISLSYGSLARVVAQRHLESGAMAAQRVLVLLGREVERGGEPELAGIVVRGDVASLNADDWLQLARDSEHRGNSAQPQALQLGKVDLQVGTFAAFGRSFHDMALDAKRASGRWSLNVVAREVQGAVTWEPPGPSVANGRVTAKLDRIRIPDASEMKPWTAAAGIAQPRADNAANPWPEIELVATQCQGRHGDLGRLEFAAKPDGSDWRIRNLELVNDSGKLSGSGWWRSRGRDQQTRLDLLLTVSDAGAYLARFGLPAAIKGAPTTIKGDLGWNGAPDDFDYPTLAGQLHVEAGQGQFTKIEPGIGKLLGVLSLQALPRRITLDFRDVFSEGFAFDTIAGDVSIVNGMMHSDNLTLNGPAARVSIAGEVDLARETQRLSVIVHPSLASSVSAGAGAAAVWLLAANPLVGAAVGAGTLLAQKMMKDPIDQMFRYDYEVRGSWAEPVVERVSRAKGEAAAQASQPDAARAVR